MITRIKSKLGVRNVTFELLRTYLYKKIYQLLKPPEGDQTTLFIVGCQRSGTSLMTRIFERDIRAKVYRESSSLSSLDKVERLRLNPLSLVRAQIQKDKASLVVLKPLVESQNTLRLLDYFPNSKALWMYRDYRDVAASNLKAFGIDNGLKDLIPIFEGDSNNWRSESVPQDALDLVQANYSEDMNTYDAAALFWYVRNSLYYELDIEANGDILLFKYEHLVQRPDESIREIYKFVDKAFPGDSVNIEVHGQSVNKGKATELSRPIENACVELQARLDKSWERQKSERLVMA